MDCRQLKDNIIVPSLTALGKCSPSAVNLLLGTMANESQMGRYLVQEDGPAIGAYQMEPLTFNDVWNRSVADCVQMRAKIRLILGYEGRPIAMRLASDIMLATIMARLKYDLVPEELPKFDDIAGLANYYKTYWNTSKGAATEQEFIDNYKRYVTCAAQR